MKTEDWWHVRLAPFRLIGDICIAPARCCNKTWEQHPPHSPPNAQFRGLFLLEGCVRLLQHHRATPSAVATSEAGARSGARIVFAAWRQSSQATRAAVASQLTIPVRMRVCVFACCGFLSYLSCVYSRVEPPLHAAIGGALRAVMRMSTQCPVRLQRISMLGC